jgi:hypothetical protein
LHGLVIGVRHLCGIALTGVVDRVAGETRGRQETADDQRVLMINWIVREAIPVCSILLA